MKEVKINEVILRDKNAEKFERIKAHMESCEMRDLSDEDVVFWLLNLAMVHYKFL